jgi:thiamine-monophosphate kinase
VTSLGPGPEFDLIRRLMADSAPLPPGVQRGPGDDCAILEGGVVVSVDISVEEVHFRREWITLEEAGYRATAGALSDLAAMAAEPLGVLLSLALPPEEASAGALALQKGAQEACSREGITILGGDLSRSAGPVVLDVVALGRTDSPLLRSGGRTGDELWVTGWLGGSAGAVHLWGLGREPGPKLREAFARPRPRIRELRWLAGRVELHCGIDLSDGLAGDAGHLAAASEVGVRLEAGAIPFHPHLEEEITDPQQILHFALQGGEDYEVCFSAPSGSVQGQASAFHHEFGIPLTRVGRMGEGSGVVVLGAGGESIPLSGGFSHFEERERE